MASQPDLLPSSRPPGISAVPSLLSLPSSSPSPSSPPLRLTITFPSSPICQLHLDISSPAITTPAALKHQIRTCLAGTPAARSRLVLINSGQRLEGFAPLAALLPAAPPPPPLSTAAHIPGIDGPAAIDRRGKERNTQSSFHHAPTERVHILCSVGEDVTDKELAEDVQAAQAPPSKSIRALERDNAFTSQPGARGGFYRASMTRGFDRLLSSTATGLTAAEVNQLHLQFRLNVASRRTPDTMPTLDELLDMEDAWLDTDSGGGGVELGNAVEGDGVGSDLGDTLDLLNHGLFIGCMFPLGSIGWLLQEKDLLPRTWFTPVLAGFIINLFFGLLLRPT